MVILLEITTNPVLWHWYVIEGGREICAQRSLWHSGLKCSGWGNQGFFKSWQIQTFAFHMLVNGEWGSGWDGIGDADQDDNDDEVWEWGWGCLQPRFLLFLCTFSHVAIILMHLSVPFFLLIASSIQACHHWYHHTCHPYLVYSLFWLWLQFSMSYHKADVHCELPTLRPMLRAQLVDAWRRRPWTGEAPFQRLRDEMLKTEFLKLYHQTYVSTTLIFVSKLLQLMLVAQAEAPFEWGTDWGTKRNHIASNVVTQILQYKTKWQLFQNQEIIS